MLKKYFIVKYNLQKFYFPIIHLVYIIEYKWQKMANTIAENLLKKEKKKFKKIIAKYNLQKFYFAIIHLGYLI